MMLKFEETAAAVGESGWAMCESCERAPAAFLCKADSASLCASCDAHIHSANPLARRHHRVPITVPLHHEEEDESASWLLFDPINNGDDDEVARPPFFSGEVDDYLDLEEYNQFSEGYDIQQQQSCGVLRSSYGGDSIVPIQHQREKNEAQHHCFQLGYGYPASISQTVSISSMDVGVVPKSASESLIPHTRPPKGTIDLFSSPLIQAPTMLSPMDREARVLRYREKKKTRKFEKTIRYASRKAYAETRPRIKGRFAKRKSAQVQVDQIFSSQYLVTDAGYGVVPSF